LIKRLEDKRNHPEVLSPQSQDDNECDAILVTLSELRDQKGMKRDAKDALEQALNKEELHVEEVCSESFVRNRRGFSFAKRIRTLERLVDEIPSLQNSVASIEVKTASHEVKTAALEVKTALLKVKKVSLEDRVGSVTSSLDAYQLLRNRFISTFKPDKLGKATDKDRSIIGVVNSWA
jgi:hypothetical protein